MARSWLGRGTSARLQIALCAIVIVLLLVTRLVSRPLILATLELKPITPGQNSSVAGSTRITPSRHNSSHAEDTSRITTDSTESKPSQNSPSSAHTRVTMDSTELRPVTPSAAHTRDSKPIIPSRQNSRHATDTRRTINSTAEDETKLSLPKTLETCRGRGLEAGYVVVLEDWEQLTAGTANLMSLQCWAATLNMVVVEYLMSGASYMIPDELLGNASTDAPQQFVRLQQIYDFDYWNTYAKGKCYAPLVKWEVFLNNAPREVIVVHIAYSVYNKPYEVQGCPPSHEYKDSFRCKYSAFLNAHNFTIIREVCLETKHRRSTREFNALILKNQTSEVTVVINVWRGAFRGGSRVLLTDTKCLHYNYFPILPQYAMPSSKLLEDVRLYREQVLGGNDYLAVMVRLEHSIRFHSDRPKSKWSPSQCLKAISSHWRDLTVKHHLNNTFWSLDVGRYGSDTYSRPANIDEDQITAEVFTFMNQYYNLSYSQVEDSLTGVSGKTNKGYIASLQLNLAVRAKCLLLVGGGSYHGYAKKMYTTLHNGTACVLQEGTAWLIKRCKL